MYADTPSEKQEEARCYGYLSMEEKAARTRRLLTSPPRSDTAADWRDRGVTGRMLEKIVRAPRTNSTFSKAMRSSMNSHLRAGMI